MSTPDNSTPEPADGAEPAGRRTAFAALRHRDFRLLWFGQFFSITGSQMQLVTINWHVYLLMRPYGEKQAAAALGLVGLVRVLPIVLCSLVGGVVADAKKVATKSRDIVCTMIGVRQTNLKPSFRDSSPTRASSSAFPFPDARISSTAAMTARNETALKA